LPNSKKIIEQHQKHIEAQGKFLNELVERKKKKHQQKEEERVSDERRKRDAEEENKRKAEEGRRKLQDETLRRKQEQEKERICIYCGGKFQIRFNTDISCRYHPGKQYRENQIRWTCCHKEVGAVIGCTVTAHKEKE